MLLDKVAVRLNLVALHLAIKENSKVNYSPALRSPQQIISATNNTLVVDNNEI